MAKKRKFETRISDASKNLGSLNYPNLKRQCLIRGMDFEKAVASTVLELQSFLIKNWKLPQDTALLDKYDNWKESYLRERGMEDVFFHPALRLGYIATRDEDGNTTSVKKIKGLKKQKIKRERTEEGLFQGTKKSYTYQLQKEGLPKTEVIAKVLEKFPDAQEKSIGIWYNKSKKGKELL
jgi:hypothetical protein